MTKKTGKKGKKRGRPKKPRLSKQRLKLAKAVVEGQSITDAGKIAGYSSPSSAHRAFTSIKIRFPEAFKALGCPVEEVLRKYVVLRDATKVEHFSHQGIVMESKEVSDNAIQLRANDRCRDLMGLDTRTLIGDDERRRDSTLNAAQSGGTTVNVVLPNGEAARDFVDALAAVQAHSRQPLLAQAPHQDAGRAGSSEPAEAVPDQPRVPPIPD